MLYEQLLTHIKEFGAELLGLYLIQDYFEIIFFILITYKFLSWLKQDNTQQLLFTFYTYFSLITITYFSSCSILFSTLLYFGPVYIVFCIIAHQKQLQKNFVLPSKKYFTPTTIPEKNWLASLVQSCLQASHKQKNIFCIIEKNYNLSALLQTKYMLQLPVQKDIINLLLTSQDVQNNTLLWVHHSGLIQSINAKWNDLIINEMLIEPKDTTTLNHEAALIMTQKTDTLIFSIDTISDTHTVWYGGKCLKQVSVQQLLNFTEKTLYDVATNTSIIQKRNPDDQKQKHSSAS
ncbi:MAG: hypothetical protein CL947_03685 [Epsilonproteobacteria bacterium]|nr:hypothetical protein [Campylobacterota bacterium]|tara:strand:+ start:4490 stop:5362 length:873 start_codon:yes stop_codon:yes gene_type:complete